MANFIESPPFPREVSAWAVGGRGFRTTVVQTYGGNEQRNAAWSQALGEWSITEALRMTNPSSPYNIAALRNFIMACQGMLYGFRFQDPQDYKDEGGGVFGAIDSTHYQMYKQYVISPNTYYQIIQKPVSPIVVSGAVGTMDYTTGIFTKSSGTPTSWTGQFDIPCRLAGDFPQIGLDTSGAMFGWQQLKIKEIRDIT